MPDALTPLIPQGATPQQQEARISQLLGELSLEAVSYTHLTLPTTPYV